MNNNNSFEFYSASGIFLPLWAFGGHTPRHTHTHTGNGGGYRLPLYRFILHTSCNTLSSHTSKVELWGWSTKHCTLQEVVPVRPIGMHDVYFTLYNTTSRAIFRWILLYCTGLMTNYQNVLLRSIYIGNNASWYLINFNTTSTARVFAMALFVSSAFNAIVHSEVVP